MTEEKLKEVYQICNDCWKFFKAHCEVANTDEFWSAVMQDMKIIAEKHNNSELCIAWLMDALGEVERIATSESRKAG